MTHETITRETLTEYGLEDWTDDESRYTVHWRGVAITARSTMDSILKAYRKVAGEHAEPTRFVLRGRSLLLGEGDLPS